MPSKSGAVLLSWHAFVAAAITGTPCSSYAQLEEIVVTAQRRETPLRKTPISMHVFSADDLLRAGVRQGRDLGIMVPNVVLNSRGIGAAGFGAYYVRGLPGVGIYVDGVWQGDRGFLETDFVEVDRLEVLRGPQGTLFGRNTNGGAVNITTRRPNDGFRARASLTAGEFGRREAVLALDVPLAEKLRSKWTAARLYDDGYLESLSVPRSLGGRDDRFLRGDLSWEPTSRFSARLTLSNEKTRTSDARIVRFTDTRHPRYLAYNILLGNPEFLSAARMIDPSFQDPPKSFSLDRFTPESHEPRYPGGDVGKWQTKSNSVEDGMAHDIESATLTLDWQTTDRVGIKAITAARTLDRRSSTDRDGSELTISALEFRTHGEYFSQEIHFKGERFAGRVDWLAGLFVLEQELIDRRHGWLNWEFVLPSAGPGQPELDMSAVQYVRDYGALLGISGLAPRQGELESFRGFTPLPPATDLLTGGEDQDRAIFGEVRVGVTNRFELTVGVRVTAHDGEVRTYVPTDGFRPAFEQHPVRGDPFAGLIDNVDEDPDLGNVTTHKFSATYELDEDLMAYASWSEGFTSGDVVYSQFLSDPIVLDPEVVSTRELGLRSSWRGSRIRFNATYFASSWDGLRVPILPDDPANPGLKLPLPVLTSEGLAEIDGWELELDWAVKNRWLITVGIGTLDAAYLDIGDPDPTGVNGIQPWSPLAYAPEESASVFVRYDLPLASGARMSFSAGYGWMDEYVRAPANQWTRVDSAGQPVFEPAYGILNASMRFAPARGRWDVELWGRNLTDVWYVNGGIDARTVWGFDFATVGASREVGVRFGFER